MWRLLIAFDFDGRSVAIVVNLILRISEPLAMSEIVGGFNKKLNYYDDKEQTKFK